MHPHTGPDYFLTYSTFSFDAEMAKKKDREEREEEQKRKEAREREEHLQSLKEADLQTDPRKNGTLGERHQALEKDAMVCCHQSVPPHLEIIV